MSHLSKIPKWLVQTLLKHLISILIKPFEKWKINQNHNELKKFIRSELILNGIDESIVQVHIKHDSIMSVACNREKCTIITSPSAVNYLLDNPDMTRFLVAHEAGHWLHFECNDFNWEKLQSTKLKRHQSEFMADQIAMGSLLRRKYDPVKIMWKFSTSEFAGTLKEGDTHPSFLHRIQRVHNNSINWKQEHRMEK